MSDQNEQVIVEEVVIERELYRDDDDLDKLDRGFTDGFNTQVRKSTDVTTDFISGFAEAVSDSIRSFNDRSGDRMTDLSVDNGMVQGTVAAYAAFFDRMSVTAREMLRDLRRPDENQRRETARRMADARGLAVEIVRELRSDPIFIEAVAARVRLADAASTAATTPTPEAKRAPGSETR